MFPLSRRVTIRGSRSPPRTGSDRAEVPQEPIEERSRPVLVGRVDDYARRLVDGDQVLILIQNREADWLRFGWQAAPIRGLRSLSD